MSANWKKIEKEEYIKNILLFWKWFLKEANINNKNRNKWVEHVISVFVRNVTDSIGKRIYMISEEAKKIKESSGKGIQGHHVIEAKEFRMRWYDCVKKDLKFEEKDAEKWLDEAQNVYLTKDEHNKIHSKAYREYYNKFKNEINKNPKIDIVKLFDKYFNIKINKYENKRENSVLLSDNIITIEVQNRIDYILNIKVKNILQNFVAELLTNTDDRTEQNSYDNKYDFKISFGSNKFIKFVCRQDKFTMELHKIETVIPKELNKFINKPKDKKNIELCISDVLTKPEEKKLITFAKSITEE